MSETGPDDMEHEGAVKKGLPLVSTALVMAASAIMVMLGFWQLDRSEEKKALIAHFNQTLKVTDPVPFPRDEASADDALYRLSEVTCTRVISSRSTAARDPKGTSGLAQVALCELAGGGQTEIMLGWTQRPQIVDWKGGRVTGWVAPSGADDSNGVRLIAKPPAFSLAQLPAPNPNNLPNNHLAYAGQWFLFAFTALLIYFLALRHSRKFVTAA